MFNSIFLKIESYTVISNPIVGIFFTVFPRLNTGVDYPWYIVVPALICSVLSLVLWMFGEKKVKTYEVLDEESQINVAVTDYKSTDIRNPNES